MLINNSFYSNVLINNFGIDESTPPNEWVPVPVPFATLYGGVQAQTRQLIEFCFLFDFLNPGNDFQQMGFKLEPGAYAGNVDIIYEVPTVATDGFTYTRQDVQSFGNEITMDGNLSGGVRFALKGTAIITSQTGSYAIFPKIAFKEVPTAGQVFTCYAGSFMQSYYI